MRVGLTSLFLNARDDVYSALGLIQLASSGSPAIEPHAFRLSAVQLLAHLTAVAMVDACL